MADERKGWSLGARRGGRAGPRIRTASVGVSVPPSSSEPVGPANLLLVEDEVVTASVLAMTLRMMGHNVTVAKSWSNAVEAFVKADFDLVLMDAILPDVDGFKLTKMLRERSVSYVPIIFLTSLTDTRSRILGIECGADDYLPKPVDEVDLNIRLTAMLRIRRLTRALEVRSQRLAELASVDVLTGLLNRRSYLERMPDFVRDSLIDGLTVSALMIDIDHFKQVNDKHGHDVGDRVIATLAQVLDENVRPGDLAFRMGGEEFLVITAHPDPTRASALAARLRLSFSSRMENGGPAGRQTISIGLVSASSLPDTSEYASLEFGSSLVKAADYALYLAKTQGRDRVVEHRHDLLPLSPIVSPSGGSV